LLPKIILDTSAINALEDGGVDSAPLMRSLAWEFEVIVSFTSLDELISTPSGRERHALVGRFERLRRTGRCIAPPHEIIRLMVSSHVDGPAGFDWTKVDVRMSPAAESSISRRDYLDDAFCAEQKREQREFEARFKGALKSVRPTLDEIPADERPGSFKDLVAIHQAHGRWALVRGLYRRVSGKELTEPEIDEFLKACPPLRALSFGQLMGFYRWSLRGQRGRKEAAGRNDLLMAAYLPYCDWFITNDRPQRQDLSEVASNAEIACQVCSFEEFRTGIA